jgi:GNAT superfamily N-acetyltransferase
MLSAPTPLGPLHSLDTFDCGIASLDNWLKRRALMNQVSGASRTFVACEEDTVVGYYALASGAISMASTPGKFRRNMAEPIPVVVLARLAVSKSHHGLGIGRGLFQDAACRVIDAAGSIGIRGMIVHAISDEAKAFYLRLGLIESPLEPMTLMVTLADLRASLPPAPQ